MYVRSPLNFTGNKFKLLGKIMPLFPTNINTFVDLFAGGCNVGINAKANLIICNDLEKPIIDLMRGLQKVSIKDAFSILDAKIGEYNLSTSNSDGFLKLRNDYNSGKREWYNLFLLSTYSFSNQIRFNKKGEFNMPFGKDKSWFNPNLQGRLETFIKTLSNKRLIFTNNDFRDLDLDKLSKNDFIYLDPPYYLSCATYNENGGWTNKHEQDLLNLCDNLNDKGIRFALSNVLESKGKSHDLLKQWSAKYKVYYLERDYATCNYQRTNDGKDVEVLIVNY